MKNDLPLYKSPAIVRREQTSTTGSVDIFDPLLDPTIAALDLDKLTIPMPTNTKLRDFQRNGVMQCLRFFKERSSKGVYNGYEPGLGKTCMSIATANTLRAKRILVICPAGLRANWETEIRTFSTIPTPSVRAIYTARGAMEPITANFCICSYSLLLKENVFKAISAQSWDLIIGDEAHEMASLRAKRTALFMRLWEKARRGILLSGTPLRRCTLDLFPAMHMLMPGEFFDVNEFAEEYCLKRSVPWGVGFEYFHGKNMPQLSAIIRENFFIRKTKAEVMTELPPVTYQKIVLTTEAKFQDIEESEATAIIAALDRGEDPGAKLTKKTFIEKRKEAALISLLEGKEFIENFVKNGTSVMLVAYHHDVMRAAAEMFQEYEPLRLDGTVTGTNKAKVVEAFNNGRSPILIIQISCAVGINLQRNCSTAIFLETSYNPSEAIQTVDRLHRMGQEFPVTAYFLMLKGSIDEQVFKILFRKQMMINEVVQSN